MTPAQLREAMPFASPNRIELFIQPLSDAMEGGGITSPVRQAAFLAQVAHESGSLRYTLELADGQGYEGRADLGNTEPGDGHRYRGRGLIQLTGRKNMALCGHALGLDLITQPELLEAPSGAARSAVWFWDTNGLNDLADHDRFGSITKKINGGFNGLDDRIAHWLRARRALGVP